MGIRSRTSPHAYHCCVTRKPRRNVVCHTHCFRDRSKSSVRPGQRPNIIPVTNRTHGDETSSYNINKARPDIPGILRVRYKVRFNCRRTSRLRGAGLP